jgi:hypothetical protein
VIIAPLKIGRVHIFGENPNESKFYPRRNKSRLNSRDICYLSV